MSEELDDKIEKVGKVTKSTKTPGLQGVESIQQVVRAAPIRRNLTALCSPRQQILARNKKFRPLRKPAKKLSL